MILGTLGKKNPLSSSLPTLLFLEYHAAFLFFATKK